MHSINIIARFVEIRLAWDCGRVAPRDDLASHQPTIVLARRARVALNKLVQHVPSASLGKAFEANTVDRTISLASLPLAFDAAASTISVEIK